MDQSRVLTPHPSFRLLATANTVGLGNLNGLYHGAQRLNHAQIDRWNVVASLDYLSARRGGRDRARPRARPRRPETGRELVRSMVAVADLTRKGFRAGDLVHPDVAAHGDHLGRRTSRSSTTSGAAFRLSFLNKCDEAERPIVAEYFQRCFDRDLEEAFELGPRPS